jgi:hypothetical protein
LTVMSLENFKILIIKNELVSSRFGNKYRKILQYVCITIVFG